MALSEGGDEAQGSRPAFGGEVDLGREPTTRAAQRFALDGFHPVWWGIWIRSGQFLVVRSSPLCGSCSTAHACFRSPPAPPPAVAQARRSAVCAVLLQRADGHGSRSSRCRHPSSQRRRRYRAGAPSATAPRSRQPTIAGDGCRPSSEARTRSGRHAMTPQPGSATRRRSRCCGDPPTDGQLSLRSTPAGEARSAPTAHRSSRDGYAHRHTPVSSGTPPPTIAGHALMASTGAVRQPR